MPRSSKADVRGQRPVMETSLLIEKWNESESAMTASGLPS